jgi:hypothetical protein
VLYLWFDEKTIIEIVGVHSLKGDAKKEFDRILTVFDDLKAEDKNFDYRIVD